ISLITFAFTQKTLGPIGLSPFKSTTIDEKGETVTVYKSKNWYNLAVFAGSLATIPIIMTMVAKTEYTDYFMYIIGPVTLLYLFFEMTRHTWEESKKLIAALVFIIFSIIFWAFFEQSGGSLSLFAASNLDNTILNTIKLDPNGVNNSANS